MVKKLNLNGKNQRKENQERDQNHQNAKNVELFGKDQNQNVLSVKLKERPKPKCPFCQAELPKPDFKKFKKPEGKPEKKEDASSSSSSSSEDEGEKKEKKEEPKEKPKFEKPKCPNCQKELPFFWGKHGHRHGFRGFGPHGGFHGHGPHGPHGPEKKDA